MEQPRGLWAMTERELAAAVDECRNRSEMADFYVDMILLHDHQWPGWKTLNRLIMERWSVSALEHIKKKAWYAVSRHRRRQTP